MSSRDRLPTKIDGQTVKVSEGHIDFDTNGSTQLREVLRKELLGTKTFVFTETLGTEIEVVSLLHLGNGICMAGTAYLGQIYRSTDYGLTWSLVQRLGGATVIYDLEYLGGGICLASVYPNAEIYRSTDYGLTWSFVQTIAGPSANPYARCLAYLGNGIVIAGTSAVTADIWRSIDYGATFVFVQTLGAQIGTSSMAYLGNGICVVATGIPPQIWRSVDYGIIWTLAQALLGDNDARVVIYLGDGVVLAGTAATLGQVWRSSDYGVTWVYIRSLGTRISAFLPLGGGTALAGTYSFGFIYRTTDYGVTWSFLQNLGKRGNITVRCFVDLGNGMIIAGTGEEHGDIWHTKPAAAELFNVDVLNDVTLRPVGGNLTIGTSDAETWSTSPVVCPAGSWTNMFNFLFQPWGTAERVDVGSILWVYFYIKYRVYRVVGATNIQERIRARNKSGTWVLISDESVAADPGATPGVTKTTSGYLLPVTNFDSIPFNMTVEIDPTVNDQGRLEVSSLSYIRAVYRMR